MTSCKLKRGLAVALCLIGSSAWADTLELKQWQFPDRGHIPEAAR